MKFLVRKGIYEVNKYLVITKNKCDFEEQETEAQGGRGEKGV